MSLVDGGIIDSVMVLCALIFNGLIIIVFLARAQQFDRLESVTGYAVNLLLVPFTVLWALNLLSGRDVGRVITGVPILLFLVDDLWYRTLQRMKPKHHPTRWPVHLYLYLVLYLVGAMLLVGYAFFVSMFYGFLVLATYYAGLAAFGYYRHRHAKARAKGGGDRNPSMFR